MYMHKYIQFPVFSDLQIAKSHHSEVGRWGANPKSSEVPSGSTAAAAAAAGA